MMTEGRPCVAWPPLALLPSTVMGGLVRLSGQCQWVVVPVVWWDAPGVWWDAPGVWWDAPVAGSGQASV